MAAAQQETQNKTALLAPQSGRTTEPLWPLEPRRALDALEEAGSWYFDDDGGGLKNFALSLDSCAPAGIARAFFALDLASYDAATCGVAVWLFDRATPLPSQQRGPPEAPRKLRRKWQKGGKTSRRHPSRPLWYAHKKCAPSCL